MFTTTNHQARGRSWRVHPRRDDHRRVLVTSPDGVRLAVHDLGGDGPPLLLSHATGFHGHVFAPLAAALSARFHCWAIDYRGHGSSERPTDGRGRLGPLHG